MSTRFQNSPSRGVPASPRHRVPASPRPCVPPLRRPAFTLVELLVVVVVIAILAGLVMGALQAARETARTAKTRATISKLHNIIMAMYESYRTRRVPISTMTASGPMNPHDAAVARLQCAARPDANGDARAVQRHHRPADVS